MNSTIWGRTHKEGLPIKFTEVIVNMTDLDCMVRTVRELDVDIAFGMGALAGDVLHHGL